MTSKSKKYLNRAIYLGSLLLGLVCGIIIFDRVFMSFYTRSTHAGEIPDVRGIELEEAEKIARKEGFDFTVSRGEHNDSIPEGIVISQRPAPGYIAKKGRRISVVFSLSTPLMVVPDVSGKHIREAVIQLERLGFVPNDTAFVHSDSFAKEFVIATEPSAGETLVVGSAVSLLVSNGAETGLVRVPNFMGQLVEDAEALGKREGLVVKATYRKIPSVPDRTVYRQSVEPGTMLQRGNTVVVIVARAKDEPR